MNPPILYEDDDLLVIDKPFGVVVNRAESVKGETVQDWVEKQFKVQSSKLKVDSSPSYIKRGSGGVSEIDFYSRSGIVHRLDKETSGCLIIAKTPESFLKLQSFFKERKVKKTYIALVHGKLVPDEGEIRAPVGRTPWNRERFGVVPGGKEAVTRYARISNFKFPTSPAGRQISNEDVSLVELYPETGRTHQIRVHLKYINHPIVGDYLYAGRKTQRADRKWCPRVFLHAAKIEFPHPKTGETVSVQAPLPKELEEVLAGLMQI